MSKHGDGAGFWARRPDAYARLLEIVAAHPRGSEHGNFRGWATLLSVEMGETVTKEAVRSKFRHVRSVAQAMGAEAPIEVTAAGLTGAERAARRLHAAKEEARLLKEAAATREDLIESFRDAMGALPLLHVPPPAPDTTPHRPRSLVLFLSDLHVGQLFERARGGGLGHYDLSVFTERVGRVASKVLAITRDLRAGGPVDRLVIVFGGDMVDGRDIHPGHDHESASIGEQLRIGPDVLAQGLLAPLAAVFPRIDIFILPGNHGRLGKKGQLDMVHDSLDLVFGDIMQLHCRALSNLHFHRSETWFCHFTLHGHRFFGSHGDSFKSWAGVPFYGAARNKQRIESLINAIVDVIITGHHHSPASFSQGFGNVVMNGSFVGTGSFGSWLGMGGPPLQKLLLVSDDYPIATTYDLILAGRSEMLTLSPVDLDALSA